jgi:aspartate kinase
MSDKIKLGGLIERSHLCMLDIRGVPDTPGKAAELFKVFSDEGISVEFISHSMSGNGLSSVTICLSADFCPMVDHLVELLNDNVHPVEIVRFPKIELITIYGPHFVDKPAVATQLCVELGEDGVNILGISTSINSVTIVVDVEDIKTVKNAINRKFEMPTY